MKILLLGGNGVVGQFALDEVVEGEPRSKGSCAQRARDAEEAPTQVSSPICPRESTSVYRFGSSAAKRGSARFRTGALETSLAMVQVL
jgi:hypothetical protein